MAAATYVVHGAIELDPPNWSATPAASAHGAALIGVFLLAKARSYFLDRYLLLYDDNGVFVGAGWADVHAELPALWLLVVAAILTATAAFVGVRLRFSARRRRGVVLFALSLIFGDGIPAVAQRYYVEPSQLQLETPYIQRAIALTQEAYNLGDVAVKPFPAEQDLTSTRLQKDSATIDNIRLWDSRPLLAAYEQLQEIRTYYNFTMRTSTATISAAPPAGDDIGARARLLAACGQRADLGQSAFAVHPRQRCRDVAGDAQAPEGAAVLLSQGHSARRRRAAPRSAEPRIYFGEGARRIRDRQGRHAGVRLSQGQEKTSTAL